MRNIGRAGRQGRQEGMDIYMVGCPPSPLPRSPWPGQGWDLHLQLTLTLVWYAACRQPDLPVSTWHHAHCTRFHLQPGFNQRDCRDWIRTNPGNKLTAGKACMSTAGPTCETGARSVQHGRANITPWWWQGRPQSAVKCAAGNMSTCMYTASVAASSYSGLFLHVYWNHTPCMSQGKR